MKTHTAVASLLTLAFATANLPALAEGQPQSPRDPDRYKYSGEPDWAESFAGIRTFTDPVLDAQMGFSFPTEVREVLVKGGDRVSEGDLLIRAKDAEMVAAVKIQRKRSENELPIRAAEVALRVIELELQGIEAAGAEGGASSLEHDQAVARRDRAQIELDQAHETFEEQTLLLERALGELDRFRLYAPFDGVIESVIVDQGQAVSETQPVLRVVKLDQLKSRVPTPTRQVIEMKLKAGDPVWVAMDLPGEPKVYVGHISEVSPVADFASQTVNVWIEVDNKDGNRPGLTTWVRFSEPTGVWAERIVVDMTGADGADPSVVASVDLLVVGAAKAADTNR